jgi:hypothetical protein
MGITKFINSHFSALSDSVQARAMGKYHDVK